MSRLPALLAATAILTAAAPPNLADMRWQKRVVLVFAPSADDPRLATQRQALGSSGAGMADRNIALVTVAGNRVEGATDTAAALYARFKTPPDRFAALLIGKDGHVAERQAVPFTTQDLFGKIDAMPMRQDEMKAGH